MGIFRCGTSGHVVSLPLRHGKGNVHVEEVHLMSEKTSRLLPPQQSLRNG